ncbi:MAG: VWA domain-containing protein [Deltaproteobacteria bacterium]|nr:VWA domain-containing protein [Deltaproteobacteria bacterium]
MKTRNVQLAKAILVTSIILLGSCREREAAEKTIPGLDRKAPIIAGRIVGAMSADEASQESVRRMKAGETGWAPVREGDTVSSEERLSVAPNGTAMLSLEAGGRVALNSGTALKVVSPTTLLLEEGDIWVEDTIGASQTGITVKTDVGEVDMKGVFAGLGYNEKKLVVSVVSGTATLRGTQKEIVLHGGQEAIADSGGVRVVHVKDPGGLVSWSRGLRDALAKPVRNLEAPAPSVTSGLGTLSAKVPGTGTPLPFEVLAQDVSVRIQDQVALTRVEQVFRNPSNRIVEGMYKFPLPSGARLTRYDMEIRGRMMRGEIVERQRGRAIMKTVIRQFIDMMRDPALVEWESGSTFKTRIFPIQAKEKKRIVLSYIQTLEGAGGKYHYVLPVSPAGARAAKIPAFRIDAQVSSTGGAPIVTTPLYPTEIKMEGRHARVGFEASDFEPMVDFVIQVDQPARPEAAMATYGKGVDQDAITEKKGDEPSLEIPALTDRDKSYFMINLAPTFWDVATLEGSGSDWILLADTSQSRNILDMEVEKRLTTAIIGALGPLDRVKVLTFDMKPRVMNNEFAIPSKDLLDKTRSFFDSIAPAGATDMAGALEEAARHIQADRKSRVIVIGDGAATLGENRPGELSGMAAGMFNSKGVSVTTIGVGSSVDSLLFKEISRRTGGRYHSLSSGEDLLAAAVRIVTGLRVPVLENPRIVFEGLGVTGVYPGTLPSLGSGEEVSITGRYKGTGRLTATLSGRLAGKDWSRDYTFDVGEAKATNTFVPLLWASRKIDALTLKGNDGAVKETVKLSKKFSLPSRYTSFIVLENEAMYREFNVKRRGDRFEWEGTGDIEYEGFDDSDMDALDDVSGIGTAGAGQSARRASGGGVAKKSMPAARPRSKSSGMSDFGDGLSGPGIGSKYKYKRRPCRRGYSYDVSVWRIPAAPKDKDSKKISELQARIEKEPLARKHRKNLVKQLLRVGKYGEARDQVATWRELDGANPTVLIYTADLMRLGGDVEGALRIYSGVLDVKPEDRKTMNMLASYLESKGRQAEAYPFRVSLNLVKPKNWKAAARRAIAAARVERWDDASRVALALIEEGRDGSPKLNKGVRLPRDLKEAVFRIALREKPPLLFEAASRSDAKSAKFRFELEWNADVDLDLWVSSRRHRFLGGGGSGARLVEGRTRGESEIVYMSNASQGLYKVQVVCAQPGGCGNVAGKLHIRAPSIRRTIPFVLENGVGSDLATVYVERWRNHCGW